MKNDLASYLNSIDFSLINGSEVLDNIYNEILPEITSLSKDPFASSSLEKLINLSDSKHLMQMLSKVDQNILYRKLGSRIIETIYKRLFDCLYKENDSFDMSVAVEFIDFTKCLNCHNGTFVIRQVLMLLGAKKVNKLEITKYTLKGDLDNLTYAKSKLNSLKSLFLDLIPTFESTDQFNTLGIFMQITKSQSLLEYFLERDCSYENIMQKGFLYEIIPSISSKKNLALIFKRIHASFMQLCINEKSSYFMQSFLRNSSYGAEVYKEIDFEEFGEDSNVIVALLESLQVSMNYELVNKIIKNFYKIDNSVFKTLLLEKYGSLDSKYLKVICNFLEMPEKHSFNCTSDFLTSFQKDWAKTKNGIALVISFSKGYCDIRKKMKFFDQHIDLFWESYKWKEGKDFVKRICGMTTGHARKKAYEIMKKIEMSIKN